MTRMLMLSYKHLMIHERQMQAVERIFRAFEDKGIPYMPVKGCNTKNLYPKPELRSMGDADILIHPEDEPQIRSAMQSQGFDFRSENDHVFVWHSKELYVELHKTLISPDDGDYYSYYGTGWQLAVRGEGFRHDLSVEDAYIFLFTHFAHHYRAGGIGCRHVVDLFVYRNAYPEMDEAYIAGELEKLRLLEFHGNILRLLDTWFRDKESEPLDELITSFIFSGGSWGTMEAGMFSTELKKSKRAGMARDAKLKAALHAIFPDASKLSYRYPVIRKCPVLLPVIWVVRWIDILFFRPKNIKRRLNILSTINRDRLLSHRQALHAVGLDFDSEKQ